MRSGFETKVARCLEENNVPYLYERAKLKYTVPLSKHVYVPDFILPNGIFIEAKGKFDKRARQKMALVVEQHKDKDIRMLFMRDNKIEKRAKSKYSDWCEKRGIKWAVSEQGIVPEEWLKEATKDAGET